MAVVVLVVTQPAREAGSVERVPTELLIVLHDAASRMAQDPNPLIANWGRHLLEDWRSLELLAEKQRSALVSGGQ